MAGPQPGPETTPGSTPAQSAENQPKQKTPEQLKAEAAAAEKRDKGKEAVKQETKGKLGEMLGGDFGMLMQKLFKSFGNFLSKFEGIKDRMANIFTAQTPEDVREITSKSKNYKVPPVKEPEKKITTIEVPKPDEKLVAYLYRCLKIPVPTKEQLEPHKKLDIRHLMFQLMNSFQFAKGKTDILNGFTKKPTKFFKNDIVFFRNAINGEITAGFVQEIEDPNVTVTTMDETGTKRTIPKLNNMCLMAFHIPGNKPKGVVPVKKKKKTEFKVDL